MDRTDALGAALLGALMHLPSGRPWDEAAASVLQKLYANGWTVAPVLDRDSLAEWLDENYGEHTQEGFDAFQRKADELMEIITTRIAGEVA